MITTTAATAITVTVSTTSRIVAMIGETAASRGEEEDVIGNT
ncbi:hypothetical protein O0S09_05890 [Methanocorpusculum sp. CW153]|uniref:Uncharacterized protein n=1 Tax=Methanocorpusculum vombati TaxID=3002864 RepID=A0ABT4INS2_9EURY|nr:hypothetical protein [Methanocorpusculum vombati]